MDWSEGEAYRLEAGAALFGRQGMQTFAKAGAGVLADETLADDFLQCAVQSGIGTLRIGTASSEQETHWHERLQEFTSAATMMEFVRMAPDACDALAADGFTGVAFNVSADQDRALADACVRSNSPLVRVAVRRWGALLQYVPAGRASAVTRSACDDFLKEIPWPQTPQWAKSLVGMTAGFVAWNVVQSRICNPATRMQLLLMDFWANRWCHDAALLEQVLTGARSPEKIAWQKLWTQMV